MTPPCGDMTSARSGCSEQGLRGTEGAERGREKPVAKLVTVQQAEPQRVRDAIAAWRTRRAGLTLGRADWKGTARCGATVSVFVWTRRLGGSWPQGEDAAALG